MQGLFVLRLLSSRESDEKHCNLLQEKHFIHLVVPLTVQNVLILLQDGMPVKERNLLVHQRDIVELRVFACALVPPRRGDEQVLILEFELGEVPIVQSGDHVENLDDDGQELLILQQLIKLRSQGMMLCQVLKAERAVFERRQVLNNLMHQHDLNLIVASVVNRLLLKLLALLDRLTPARDADIGVNLQVVAEFLRLHEFNIRDDIVDDG